MANQVIHQMDTLYSIFNTNRGKEYQGNLIEQANRPEIQKIYTGPYIRLKKKRVQINKPLEHSLFDLNMLEKILLTAYSYTAVKFFQHQPEHLWSVPSAGACYPVDLYLVIRKMNDVAPGVYYYSALNSTLHKVANLDYEYLLNESLLEDDQQAAFHIIFTVNSYRSCWKYSNRGYRFSMIDTGHMISNFQMTLQAIDLEFSTYTHCRAQYIKPFLHLNQVEEPVAIISVKGAGDECPYYDKLQDHEKQLNSNATNYRDTLLFNWELIEDFQKEVHRTTTGPTENWLASYQTPNEWEYDEILSMITKRRSSSAFLRLEISNQKFHELFHFLQELNMPFEMYCVVQSVEGVIPGVYQFDGGLKRIKEGDYSQTISDLCLSQEIVRDAPVTCFFTYDTSQLQENELWRFQKATMEVGVMSQLTYLKAQSCEFGYSAIAGYYDTEVRSFFELENSQQILLAGVLGIDDPSQGKVKRDRIYLNRPGKKNCQA